MDPRATRDPRESMHPDFKWSNDPDKLQEQIKFNIDLYDAMCDFEDHELENEEKRFKSHDECLSIRERLIVLYAWAFWIGLTVTTIIYHNVA